MSETPPTDSGAPAEVGQEGQAPPQDQVQIALGPHDIYPESLRPRPAKPTPAPPTDKAPEPEPSAAPEPTRDIAGPETEPQGSRRQRGDDAYQRGLAEGRAALEREQAL